MPDSRRHRGPHPRDRELFAAPRLPALRLATAHLSWLLSRGYALPSALKLVGDRHALTQRQRAAVTRAACSDEARVRRCQSRQRLEPGAELWIDGFNVLLTVEVALGGGVVFRCRDECSRDIASVHGTYRRVEETSEALSLVGRHLQGLAPSRVVLLLDSPVSNSARLGRLVLEDWGHRFETELMLVPDPDRHLRVCSSLVATADSEILDECSAWVNLASDVIQAQLPSAWVVDLSWDPAEV